MQEDEIDNEGWGEWEEQDPTQDSEIWSEEQREKKIIVDKVVEKRQKDINKVLGEKQDIALAKSLQEEEYQMLDKRQQAQTLDDVIEQQKQERLLRLALFAKPEPDTKDSMETSRADEEKLSPKRNSHYSFFDPAVFSNARVPKNDQFHTLGNGKK